MEKLQTPIVMINFKTYEESTSANALELAQICDQFESVSICVSALDLEKVAKTVGIPVLAQHVDGFDYGSHTGKILPEMVKLAGGVGSLINHSEDRVGMEAITAAVEDCKKESMLSVVCVKDAYEAQEVAKLTPDYIAIEPPELIGGDVSVTSANPQIVADSVSAVHEVNKDIPVLCGAGVKSKTDVAKAIELGAVGVLVASGIVKAENTEAAIQDLVDGLA